MAAAELWEVIRVAVARHWVRHIDVAARAQAAVLLPILAFESGPRVLFTRRSATVEHHQGEISFPGGVVDPQDRDLRSTALREAQEEVGIAPADVDVLGPLSHHVTRSGFHVSPYVGIVQPAPYAYRLRREEVAEVLEVPLGHLLDSRNAERYERQRDGERVVALAYRWNGRRIHGATAAILHSFLVEVAKQLGDQRSSPD